MACPYIQHIQHIQVRLTGRYLYCAITLEIVKFRIETAIDNCFPTVMLLASILNLIKFCNTIASQSQCQAWLSPHLIIKQKYFWGNDELAKTEQGILNLETLNRTLIIVEFCSECECEWEAAPVGLFERKFYFLYGQIM